jgi:urease accessory protein
MNKLLSTFLLSLASFSASAHSGHETSSFFAGLTHPFGADHLLAMMIVGVWSAITLPRRLAILGPLAFIAALVTGAISSQALVSTLNISSMNSYENVIELCVALSLVAVSVLLINHHLERPVNARATRVGLALVVFAGLFHGQAHGLEAPLQQLDQYIVGFVLTSIGLHLLGFTAALFFRKHLSSYLQKTIQAFGLLCAFVGLGLTGIAFL